MKIIVTGSSGFIGSNVLSKARQIGGIRTVGIDKDGRSEITLDLADGDAQCPDSVWEGAAAVIHLASRSVVYVPPGEEQSIINHNVSIAEVVAQKAKRTGVPLMIHASSSAVYGDKMTPPYTESDECTPLGAYGQSKLESEEMLDGIGGGLKIVSFRLFNAIGYFQKQSMLPWLILEAVKTRKPITLFGETWRSWTAVDDIVRAFFDLVLNQRKIRQGHTIINYGLDKPLSQLELFRMFERAAGWSDVPHVMGERRPFEMLKTQPDLTQMKQLLAPEVWPTWDNLEQAVRDVIRYGKDMT